MTDRRQRVEIYHARPDIPHHGLHLPTLLRRVTMDVAPTATRLGIPFRTMLEALTGIQEQIGTVVAQRPRLRRMMMSAAIHCYHLAYYALFSVDTRHGGEIIYLIRKVTQIR